MSSQRPNRKVTCLNVLVALLLECAISGLPISRVYAESIPQVVRDPARGVFLIATKNLRDGNFSNTVVLLTDHRSVGSVGLIINRASNVSVTSIVPDLRSLGSSDAKLHFGGPVSLHSVRILVNSPVDVPSSERLMKNLYFVNSIAVLRSLLKSDEVIATRMMRYYAGYAAWSPGQLQQEIARGDWRLIAADINTVFADDVEVIWQNFAEQLEGTWVLLDNDSKTPYR
ncbi:MAG: putative transcriptional regulator [Gammaproteobacteria bacterium]|jgi:putative transcriptional regulator